MDYRMMPPPPSTSHGGSAASGSVSGDYSGAGGGGPHYANDSTSQLFGSNDQQAGSQGGNMFPAAPQYKVGLARTHYLRCNTLFYWTTPY